MSLRGHPLSWKVSAWEEGYFACDDDSNPYDTPDGDALLAKHWQDGKEDGILDRYAYCQLKKSKECSM